MEYGAIFIAMVGATIPVVGSVAVVTISYYLTKKNEREAAWRKEKLLQYRALLTELSRVAVSLDASGKPRTDQITDKSSFQIAEVMNSMMLIAPESFLKRAHQLFSAGQKDFSKILKEMVSEIRKDLDTPNAELSHGYECILYSGVIDTESIRS